MTNKAIEEKIRLSFVEFIQDKTGKYTDWQEFVEDEPMFRWYIEESHKIGYLSALATMQEEMERMKCLYAENYRQLLAEAENLYQHYPNNFRKTAGEYFLEEKEFLADMDKERT